MSAARHYEPPLCEEGSPIVPGQEEEIAPGVKGYAIESDGWIFIPLVIGEGDGSVGRFLDSCTARCVFASVINQRLRGMLERRGYVEVPFGGYKGYVWQPKAP